MKRSWFFPFILNAFCASLVAEDELALVMTNENPYQVDELSIVRREIDSLKHEFDELNVKMSGSLRFQMEELSKKLADTTSNSSQDLQTFKSEIGKIYEKIEHLYSKIHLSDLQADASDAIDTSLPAAAPTSGGMDDATPSLGVPASPINASVAQKPQSSTTQDRIFKYRPELKRHDFYAYGEFLYWKVEEQGIDYVLENVPTLPSRGAPFSGTTSQIGNVTEGEYAWQAGFRVGAGAVITPDYWDIEAQYTYIAPDGTDSAASDPFGNPPTHIQGTIDEFTGTEINYARAHASLSLHLGDLFLAKRFQLSKQILMRLDAGVTGAWIHQRFIVDYFAPPPSFHDRNSMKWEFEGGGLKVGVETDWFFGSGLSLLGKFKAALLYGNYENKLTNFVYNQSDGSLYYTEQNNHLHDHRLVPTLQLALGPSWGWKFSQCVVNLYALYELNLWYNVQEFLFADVSSGQANGRNSRYTQNALGLQGFTGGIQINF